ncbi:MAG: hypothetical protein E7271_01470 [Lachnospiraceae bacterium]|jgi:hypothetical protein|nr:hypothetical protein [Lachnospiraceae bacterium]MCR5702021.1 hypothetical protein [Lachnospiraceae bacterium]
MELVIVTIILSAGIAFSLSIWIVSSYLKKSNDYGDDFGEMFDVVLSSMKITEQDEGPNLSTVERRWKKRSDKNKLQ